MQNSAPLPKVSAVLFDAYGTLFDLGAIALEAERQFPGQGTQLAALWRDKQLEYARLCSMGQRYRPFWDLTVAALSHAAAKLALPMPAEQHVALLRAHRHVAPYPEAHAVLHTLRSQGVPTGILSNGDPAMLADAAQSAGLAGDGIGLLDHLISIEPVKRYKPDPAAYALGPQALALPASEILFVSSNGWDVLGARWAGHPTLWVNRHGLPPDLPDGATPDPTAHRTGSSLQDVLACFA